MVTIYGSLGPDSYGCERLWGLEIDIPIDARVELCRLIAGIESAWQIVTHLA